MRPRSARSALERADTSPRDDRTTFLDAGLRWLPVVLWAALISVFSTQYFGESYTGGFIYPALKLLLPHARPETLVRIHHAIRKLAHLTEYAILALLFWRAVEPGARRSSRAALVTVLACAAYAALDEAHQLLAAGRTASMIDVAIDTAGAGLGVAARSAVVAVANASRRWRA